MNIDFTTKEQVIFFMMTTSISLSHYDYKFISNMQSLTHDKKQITSGQAELFDKLLHKYRKQFATNGYDSTNLVEIPWKCIVVESLPKYTNANVDWDDSVGKMTIRVPFKKEFISKFRKEMTTYFPVDDYTDNTQQWTWISERKRYEAEPSTHALKLAYDILPNYFTTVYHNEVKDVIKTLEQTNVEYKDPTLVCIDGEYSVVSSNKVLDELLADVTLSNTPECLYQISQFGINVDKPITQGNPELEFAANYIVECDIDKINDWCNWLVKLGVTDLALGRGTPENRSYHTKSESSQMGIFRECREAFQKHNLDMHRAKGESLLFDVIEESDKKKTIPVLVQFNSIVEPEQCHGDNRNGKIIIITNRRPVTIK